MMKNYNEEPAWKRTCKKEIKQKEFIMACFYELILLHTKIYYHYNEFLRAIIFLKYISQSNNNSCVIP